MVFAMGWVTVKLEGIIVSKKYLTKICYCAEGLLMLLGYKSVNTVTFKGLNSLLSTKS